MDKKRAAVLRCSRKGEPGGGIGPFLGRTGSVLLVPVILVCAILFLSLLPDLLAIRLNRVVINFSRAGETLAGFFQSVVDGSVFLFRAGTDTRNFLSDSFYYLKTSFLYMFAAGILSIVIGVPAGIAASGPPSPLSRGITAAVEFFGALLDFVSFIILQLAVILFRDLTGIRLARIASSGYNHAVLLPLIAMTLYPLLYIIRTTSNESGRLRGENFIQAVKGRGIPPVRIYLVHLLPGILFHIRRELPRIYGIIIASLFIAERIFNLTGITRFLFSYAFSSFRAITMSGYQYNVTVLSLLSMVLLFLGAYGLSFLAIRLASRVFGHE